MAIGDNSTNSNNNKKNYSKEYYSQYTMSNVDGVESSKLSYSIWAKNCLKISISPQKKTNDDSVAFDYENNIAAFLTHTKALILLNMINNWEKDNCRGNVGVTTGSGGFIIVSDGSEYKVDSPCIVIGSIDSDGNIKSQFVYTTRTEYHYGIKNFDRENIDFEKEYLNNIEIEQLKIMLKSYVEASTTCVAATVAEELNFKLNSVHNEVDAIAEKLGVSTKSGKGASFNAGGGSYFDNKNKSQTAEPSKQASIDDLDSGLE